MDAATKQLLISALATALTLGIAWVWKLNTALKQTPPEVLAASPHRWSEKQIKETYQRIQKNPIDWAKHLPPKLDRRYIVTGGSGGVGGTIVLHLLARGQPPESIRIIDFRKPERADMASGPASLVDFAQADISSEEATLAVFSKPWPSSVKNLPLTVFHTAAIIVPYERSLKTYERVKRVNIDGVRHVLAASQGADASVFVSTSSASVAYKPVQYWGNPFRPYPHNFLQIIDDSDFDLPLRPHNEFFSNYAHAKGVAERLISAANRDGFRTGIVRPANGIYGSSYGDQVVGMCLRAGTVPTWMRNIAQNFVAAGHVSLAHMLFETALLQGTTTNGKGRMPGCAGRAFTVTDAGAPPLFDDFYNLLKITAETPRIEIVYLQPAVMLVLAHAVEWIALASRMPVLRRVVPRPRGDLAMLQPATFSASTHFLAADAAARRSVAEGGIGYVPVHDTMEGMCQQVLDWNVEHRGSGDLGSRSSAESFAKRVRNVGTMPAAVGA
ncbi:NAD(P)-binding protein [Annulohypoxylon truncatum]|uniref:NAD(P)-binding protein n=1 Tax=Annulohypoxylon truncatum TaxID=327061 RepID=UPI00200894C2|nr:NAD(P)-binding protein [Annulohypoxylon truncatum]KAI1205889.1 NAD(P)-binding protein [Annulohypoxylon truncatum]